MRTNIEIDDGLMADALKATGLSTKKDVVELGLKALCSGLMEPDTLIRDNNNQLLRCQNGTETNIQTIF